MTTERPCPACGAPVAADATFCGRCDSLLSPALERRPAAGAPVPAPPPTSAEPARPADEPVAPRVPVVPSQTIACWSCETPNTPSRMFCVNCGSFIAIGSQSKSPPLAEPFSGTPPEPGDADADASLPLIEGVAPLGSYSVEEQRRATRRTRTITAVTSVVLAMVIGGAALYLASPLGDHDGAPELAAVVPATTEPAPTVATDQTSAVSGISVQPEPVLTEPEAVVEPEPEAVLGADPIVEPEAAQIDTPDPAAPEEADVEPITEREVAVEVVADAADAAEPELRPVEDEPAGYQGGWVCNSEVAIEDRRVRDWSIGRVSFRRRAGFERVVLELERAGGGSGQPPAVTAEAMGSWKVEENVSGTDRPGIGRRSVVLQLDDGFTASPDLRRYRPSGLDIIKEFSIYPAGRDGRTVVISADTGGCYRLRIPAWDDPSASVRRAEIHLDIRP